VNFFCAHFPNAQTKIAPEVFFACFGKYANTRMRRRPFFFPVDDGGKKLPAVLVLIFLQRNAHGENEKQGQRAFPYAVVY